MKKPATPKRSGFVMDVPALDRDRHERGGEHRQDREDSGAAHPFLASSFSSWRST